MNELNNWRMQHWSTFADGEVCVLTMDCPDTSQNVLSARALRELNDALAEIENTAPSALLIQSGKTNGFIVGADVGEFGALTDEQQALQLLDEAHRVFDRLAALPMPTIALINGHCLGGGLELALACDYRVAIDAPTIRIGLPEVLLGIHPGFGGSVRLLDVIGVRAGLPLMLAGRTFSPKRAARLGLIDYAAPERQFLPTARYLMERKPRVRRIKAWRRFCMNNAATRVILGKIMHAKLRARVHPQHYPAPYALLELWRTCGGNRRAMMRAERRSVAKLINTPTSRNLVRVFFLREALTAAGKTSNVDANETSNVTSNETSLDASNQTSNQTSNKPSNKTTTESLQRVHIIGAGVMGGDIAAWCALRGMQVSLHDRHLDALGAARARAHQLFTRKLDSKLLAARALDRLSIDVAGDGARRADVIIEAIVEDVDAKCALFDEVQTIARADALLATNTSAIELGALRQSLDDPGRLVGLHFFNPVAKMQLIEVIGDAQTRVAELERACRFALAIGRLPLRVTSAPGFLVNRALAPYLLEAVALLDEGVPCTLIDRAAFDLGMPIGPMMLADTIGLDVCLQVARQLHGDAPMIETLQQRVARGHLGRKSGQGFYRWRANRAQPESIRGAPPPGAAERLLFAFLNEAVACWHDKLVDNADLLDAGMVFGAGFAPHLGGPMHHIAAQGGDNMLWRLTALQDTHGDRFKPHAGWRQLTN